MNVKRSLVFLFSAMILLSGCGFHLRTQTLYLDKKYPTVVLMPSGSHSLYQTLSHTLISRKARVLESTESTTSVPLRIKIISEELEALPLVYGPEGDLRRERLKYTVRFSLLNQTEKEQVFFTARDRQINNRLQRLGDDAEKALIEKEMQLDIVQQLARFLASEHN